ncbi:MAG: DEAD/DEAH box helicase [Muribaculaceae bacterium]|nr:DEAD/DEAH box helicase [Muribaculaceae bacterium]
MNPQFSLDNIFSSLTPIRSEPLHSESISSHHPLFRLDIRNGAPYIIRLLNPKRSLSIAEARLSKEISRISEYSEPQNIDLKKGETDCVSLRENPYLLNLITPECHIEGPNGGKLTFHDDSAYPILRLSVNDDAPSVETALVISVGGNEYPSGVFLDDTHVLCGDDVFSVKSIGQNYASVAQLLAPIDKSLIESFLTLFLSYVSNVTPEINGIPPRYSKHTEHAMPTLFLEKVAADKALYLRTGSTIESSSGTLPPGFTPTVTATIDDNYRISIRKVEDCDISERTDRLESLIMQCAPNRNAKKEVYRDGNFFIIPEETAGPFLIRQLPQVLEDFRLVGSDKLKEYRVVAVTPKVNFKFSSGIDFLEGEGDVEIGGETFSIADILKQYSSKRYVQLSDGNRGIIDETYIQRLQRLFRRRDKDGHIKVTIFDLPEIEELIQSKVTGPFAARSRKVLEGFNSLKKDKAPKYKVNATLRRYQVEGVKWLSYLYKNDLGGCLADDMGLGKTLQTIALLSTIYPTADKPTLIIMPRSLLFNWEKELAKFCPDLTHYTYYGLQRDLTEAMKANVVLTTYALVRNDIEEFKKLKFECIVLDESQNIKNFAAQTTAAVMLLDAKHRFALSGTPMENNLTELYSLFRFLNPTMFGTLDDFNASYTNPIQRYGDKDASESLRRKIFPFILRRLKKDVLDDLPDRIDQTIYVEMSDAQKRLYDMRRISYRKQIDEAIARDGINKSQFIMFQALNELRRIASVPESVSDGSVSSPKIDELVDSILASASNGHKSVVFFNFIAGLEIVMSRLEKMGIQFETMTGSTSAQNRKKRVERFQSDPECMVMLLTLKVGGVGLNLTAADTVYIFEPWWNKAAEEQAINRLHRIGQKKTVTSFSIITVGTIEEKMLQLQAQKSELFDELISADTASSKHLTEKDIEFILS